MDAVNILFLTLWVVIGFFVFRYVGSRYFHEPHRADVAAAAVAVAVAVGALWPNSPRIEGTAQRISALDASPPANPPLNLKPFVLKRMHLTNAEVQKLRPGTNAAIVGSLDSLYTLRSPVAVSEYPIGATIYANGWVADYSLKEPVHGIVFVVDSKRIIDETPWFGTERADLAYMWSPDSKSAPVDSMPLAYAGFGAARLSAAVLGGGEHTIQAAGVSNDHRRYFLVGKPTSIVIK
jgi:hypothetical protein